MGDWRDDEIARLRAILRESRPLLKILADREHPRGAHQDECERGVCGVIKRIDTALSIADPAAEPPPSARPAEQDGA
ncbi:MAG TPA: hypothetical protein VEA38_25495 [Terriglobales bacterium]|nr:hypothetical protein [Terriglobales bacterium]